MPLPKGQERGVRSPYRLRAGIDIPRFRGVNTQGDPGCIGEDEFQKLENVRHNGVFLEERPGLTKVTSGGALTGSVYGVFDEGAQDGGTGGAANVRIYAAGDSSVNGAQLYAYDDMQTTVSQGVPLNSTLSAGIATSAYPQHSRNRLLVGGSSGYVGSWTPAAIPTGSTLLASAPSPSVLFRLATDALGVSGFTEAAGVLYVTARYSGGSRVYSYDGATVAQEDEVAGAGLCLQTYREEVYATYATTGLNTIRKRNLAGTWSSLTMPGTMTQFSGGHAMVYKDVLYISGETVAPDTAGAYLLSWNGTTCAVARGPLGGGANSTSAGLAVFNGCLYWLYHDKANNHAVIAKYDGSTWTDAEKNLSTQLGGTDYTPFGLTVFKDNLYAILDEASPAQGVLIRSPGTTTSGTWVTADSGTTVYGFSAHPGMVVI